MCNKLLTGGYYDTSSSLSVSHFASLSGASVSPQFQVLSSLLGGDTSVIFFIVVVSFFNLAAVAG